MSYVLKLRLVYKSVTFSRLVLCNIFASQSVPYWRKNVFLLFKMKKIFTIPMQLGNINKRDNYHDVVMGIEF